MTDDLETLRPEVAEAVAWLKSGVRPGTRSFDGWRVIRAELLRLQSTESRANEWQLRAERAEAELATAQNTIAAQQDTMGALKRKLALAEGELAAIKAKMKPCAQVVGGKVRVFMDPDDEGKYVAVLVVEE